MRVGRRGVQDWACGCWGGEEGPAAEGEEGPVGKKRNQGAGATGNHVTDAYQERRMELAASAGQSRGMMMDNWPLDLAVTWGHW